MAPNLNSVGVFAYLHADTYNGYWLSEITSYQQIPMQSIYAVPVHIKFMDVHTGCLQGDQRKTKPRHNSKLYIS
jgi:hypothetical protein